MDLPATAIRLHVALWNADPLSWKNACSMRRVKFADGTYVTQGAPDGSVKNGQQIHMIQVGQPIKSDDTDALTGVS